MLPLSTRFCFQPWCGVRIFTTYCLFLFLQVFVNGLPNLPRDGRTFLGCDGAQGGKLLVGELHQNPFHLQMISPDMRRNQ